jgi:hypothetical protein
MTRDPDRVDGRDLHAERDEPGSDDLLLRGLMRRLLEHEISVRRSDDD